MADSGEIGGLAFDVESESGKKSVFFGEGKRVEVLNVFKVTDKTRTYKKKTNVVLMVPPIYTSCDGLGTYYYCIDGEWWMKNVD